MEEESYTSTNPLAHTGPVMGSLYLYLYSINNISYYNFTQFTQLINISCSLHQNSIGTYYHL